MASHVSLGGSAVCDGTLGYSCELIYLQKLVHDVAKLLLIRYIEKLWMLAMKRQIPAPLNKASNPCKNSRNAASIPAIARISTGPAVPKSPHCVV